MSPEEMQCQVTMYRCSQSELKSTFCRPSVRETKQFDRGNVSVGWVQPFMYQQVIEYLPSPPAARPS